MINILDQSRSALVNYNNFLVLRIGEYIKNSDGEREATIEAVTVGNGENEGIIVLAYYETEERAKEILADIYAKISEGKTTYKMPKE